MFKHVLVPTDGSSFSNRAVAAGAGLAQALGAKLLLLHVRSPVVSPHHVEGGALSSLDSSAQMREIEAEERALLDAALGIAISVHPEAQTAFVAGYSIHDAIARIAQEQGCDLIVMASHGRRGITSLLLGSEAQKVLTHSTIPVLIIR